MADGSDGSLDDFYVYSKIEPNVVVLDQFNKWVHQQHMF